MTPSTKSVKAVLVLNILAALAFALQGVYTIEARGVSGAEPSAVVGMELLTFLALPAVWIWANGYAYRRLRLLRRHVEATLAPFKSFNSVG